MARCFFCLVTALLLLLPGLARAQDDVLAKDDGPPIAITSPDTGSTFVYGSLKDRQLYWNKHTRMLIARVTFTDSELSDSTSPQDDTLEFRLPGIAFDEARGIFSATTVKGEVIPIARIKKALFLKTIQILPNARVRVIRNQGNVSVILEAISPNDPAMHPAPTNPDGVHEEPISKLLSN